MCQLRVFVASIGMALVGYVVGRALGMHILLPFVAVGTFIGWLGGNIANKTIFAPQVCNVRPYHDR